MLVGVAAVAGAEVVAELEEEEAAVAGAAGVRAAAARRCT